jgi:hypothetical protein
MFEHCTEVSRRAIFFARYEAGRYGAPYMETEHLLRAYYARIAFSKTDCPRAPPNRLANESKSVCRSPCNLLRPRWIWR